MGERDSARCERCETLPERPAPGGRLYLWFPVWHSFMKTTRILNRADLEHEVLPDTPAVAIRLEEGGSGQLARELRGQLTSQESAYTKALYLETDRDVEVSDFGRVTTLDRFLSLGRAGWLLEMLQEERLTSLFQPIVHASDTGRVAGHEMLVRGTDPEGELIGAGAIFSTARNADLLFQVDVAARRTAIERAAEAGIETEEDLESVREHGVDLVQGHLIAAAGTEPSPPPARV